jgi:hypothetical protein
MGTHASAINLQFGNQGASYQDLIPFTIGNIQIHDSQIMPSSRGSHSEISGT